VQNFAVKTLRKTLTREERITEFRKEFEVNPHLRRLVGIKDVDISNNNSRQT